MAIRFGVTEIVTKTPDVTKCVTKPLATVTKSDDSSVTQRRGRPPKGERAMTDAEKQRAYRARKRGTGNG